MYEIMNNQFKKCLFIFASLTQEHTHAALKWVSAQVNCVSIGLVKYVYVHINVHSWHSPGGC